jgi:hypothetical protein
VEFTGGVGDRTNRNFSPDWSSIAVPQDVGNRTLRHAILR